MLLAAISLLVQDAAPAPPAPPSATLTISIRADPSIARQVNDVLARLAEPTVSEVPATDDLATALRAECGNLYLPDILATQQTGAGGTIRVRHAPCVAFAGTREFTIEQGDTLENLAEVAGFRPSAFGRAEVRQDGTRWTAVNLATLRIGDRIRFVQTPAWITLRLSVSGATARATFISALAEALNCPASNAENCLSLKGLDLIEAGPRESAGFGAPPPEPAGSAAAISVLPVQLQALVQAYSLIDRGAMNALASDAAASMSEGPTPPEPDAAAAAASVPEDQWPYDARLVRAVIGRSEDLRRTTIGVADAGLANHTGSPLPEAIFERNTNETMPEPDGTDDDGNRSVDDIFGAGVPRTERAPSTGDLGLCPGVDATAQTLSAQQRGSADHGPMVASLATGIPLRPVPENRALPRLIFYRMSEDLCARADDTNVSPSSIEQAMNYLFDRSKLVVISYGFTAPASPSFVRAVSPVIERGERLLVLPSGNASIANLDVRRVCPACLGDPDYGRDAAEHTIVVGAATRDLRIVFDSNRGPRTVFIYAPGDPRGALDLAGAETSAYGPSTSWAAPHVGLAVALMRAQGIEEIREIRERIAAATWSMRDTTGANDASLPGVLNLTQAIAISHDSVQVMRPTPGGGSELRTYVGTLLTAVPLLCPERSLTRGAAHSIRMGHGNGATRELTVRFRTFDPHLGRYPSDVWYCTLPGSIQFDDLLAGPQTFNGADVAHILLPLRQ